MAEDDSKQPIVIKKIVKGGGHHGGAWKVAYADFVTAMMAFFLLMWLLNITTDEQKAAISNYFDPTHPKISQATSGSGGLLGGLSAAPDGAMATVRQPINQPRPTQTVPKGQKVGDEHAQGEDGDDQAKSAEDLSEQALREELRERENERFEEAQKKIEQAIQENPELAALAENLIVDITPEGLRIQIVDNDGASMFPSGSAQMYPRTQALLAKVTEIIQPMPNEVSVRGHTDSVPFGASRGNYTNWELSADRANSSRRVLLSSGLPSERLNNVVGKAATDPLLKDDPENARNRRISLILLREELTKTPEELLRDAKERDAQRSGERESRDEKTPQRPRIGTFRRTQGNVEFP